jgi:hypothetical protein
VSRSIPVPPNPCPKCGYLTDTASNATGTALPAPGMLAICLKCGALLRYDDAMVTRALPAVEELRVRVNNPELDRIERALHATWAKLGRPK